MHAHELEPIPSIATTTPTPMPAHGVASVAEIHDDGGWWLRFDGRQFRARQATSCLVRPEVGDTVWFAGDDEHGAFVLAVLLSASPGTTRLAVPADLELVAEGRVRVEGRAGVEIHSAAKFGLQADDVRVQARAASLTFVELRAVVRTVFASLARVTRVGQLLELLVDTVVQRSNSSYRAIAGVDHHEAEAIHQQASGDLHLEARRALINGNDLVKMDADQIHLG